MLVGLVGKHLLLAGSQCNHIEINVCKPILEGAALAAGVLVGPAMLLPLPLALLARLLSSQHLHRPTESAVPAEAWVLQALRQQFHFELFQRLLIEKSGITLGPAHICDHHQSAAP